jgi:hypothetical protein
MARHAWFSIHPEKAYATKTCPTGITKGEATVEILVYVVEDVGHPAAFIGDLLEGIEPRCLVLFRIEAKDLDYS